MSLINKEVSDFTVQAFHEDAFKEISKKDILGKWSVFFFYPADFTFVCPSELEDLANTYEAFGSFTLKKVESLKYGLNKLFFCQIYLILYSYFKVLYGIIYIGR